MEPVDLSSTAVREAVARGEDPSGLVPDAVASVIAAEGLYR
jgi:nicotinic acid mononucleotide adenylyltransferase